MKQLILSLALLSVACLQLSFAIEKQPDAKAPAKPATTASVSQVQVFTSLGNFTI